MLRGHYAGFITLQPPVVRHRPLARLDFSAQLPLQHTCRAASQPAVSIWRAVTMLQSWRRSRLYVLRAVTRLMPPAPRCIFSRQ